MDYNNDDSENTDNRDFSSHNWDDISNIETDDFEENENISEELKQTLEIEPEKVSKKKKKKVSKIIINVLTIILFIVIVLEAGIGIINMQRISNNEDPIWYLNTKKTETDLKTVTEYHLGLYKIVKTDTSKETKITLKPFFLKD